MLSEETEVIKRTNAGVSLSTHNSSSPVSLGILVLVGVARLDGRDKGRELSLVLSANLSESENGSGLLVDDSSESGLALHNGVWNTHLAAKGWEEDNQLNWVNVVGNENERSLLVLNETNNVVETVLDGVWLLGDILLLLALSDSGSLLGQTLLLLGLGLWAVLVEKLEGLGGKVLVEGVLELSDGWWDLQAEVQDLLLALKADILWPLHHAGEVAGWLNILADTEVAASLLEERVLQIVSHQKKCALGEDTNLGLLHTGLRGGECGNFLSLWRLYH